MCDLHVHTRFSCDSETPMEAYCQRAVASGVGTICFTDHIDFNPRDYGYGYYDADAFFAEFRRAQDRFGDRLRLLAGVEFSEPHVYRKEFERYLKLPYDFVIGSVHYWHEDMFPSEMVKAGVPADMCWRGYWREVSAAVEAGGFDCLGHADFSKRYYGETLADDSELREIARVMVKNGICPEINTSSLRKGLTETMPGRRLLAIYRAAGGAFATVGSDAHTAEDLAAGRGDAAQLMEECGLREAVFAGRRLVPVL